jgi:hydrogenase nickel incorporation protein HypA/HybF
MSTPEGQQNPYHPPVKVRIIGIGQDVAGDDGVGLQVIAALRDRPSAPGLELHALRDPTALIELMDNADSVIVIDALIGRPPGSIHVLDLESLSRDPPSGLSSHGIGVAQAVALAHAVLANPPRELKIVAIGIDAPRGHSIGLSPLVRAAVPSAADLVLMLTSRGLVECRVCGHAPCYVRVTRESSNLMHESGLAKQVLEAALRAAVQEPARRIRVVRGFVAETEALDPIALELHFVAHARGTCAEGARLELSLTHVRARCLGCGHTYAPDHHVTLCPRCGAVEAELLGRTGFGIDTIEIDDSR